MIVIKKNILFFLCIIYGTISGQQTAMSYFDSINVSTITSFEEKENIIETLLRNSDTISLDDQAQLNYKYWKVLWKKQNKKKAKKYILKEFDLRKSLKDQDLLKRNLYNLGYIHSRLDIPEFEQSLQYFDTLLGMTDRTEYRLGTIYREKGDIYDQLGDFQRALENYHNAERIQKQQNLKGKLLWTYINISGTFAKLQDSIYFDDFFGNKEKLDELTKTYGMSPYQRALILMNEGTIYGTKRNYKKTALSYKNAEKLAKEIENDELTFGVLNNLGSNAIKLGQFEEAAFYFQESTNYSNGERESVGSTLNNTGDLYMKLGHYQEALNSYQQAISYLLTGDNKKETNTLPTLAAIKISPYKIDLLEYLIDKSEALFTIFQKTKEDSYLREASNSIILIDQIIDDLYFESREDLSKLFWRKKGAQLYVMAVAICFELGDEERAFYYMEKNKGMMLLENISDTKAKQLGNVPDDVVTRMRSFQIEINDSQSKLSDLSSTSSLKQTNSLKDVIFVKKEAYRAMIDSLAFSFPKYYAYKKKVDIITIEKAIKRLDDGEGILSYILGDREGYVAYISKSGIELKRIDDIEELNKDIAHFCAFLRKPFQSKEDETAFSKIAFRLKQKLMPFVSSEMSTTISKLSIVPDGNIYAIPFEALVSNSEAPLIESYLIRDFEIFYRYSLSVDAHMEQQKANNDASFIGFIPGTFRDNYLTNLNNSQNEVDEISSVLASKVFTDSMATKSSFLREYMNSSIVHVSTHGSFENNNPGLGFYDEKLFLDELYFLNSTKEMVVLSACKTSVGNQAQGEGVFNFTRGFINSGAKSVVTTLWDVNEKSSSEVISSFYKNLVSGDTKSESLRKAKFDYLEGHKNTSEASPFYWSAIVLTGDNSPIIRSNQWMPYFWIVLLLILIITAYILFRNYKKNI